MCFSAQIAFDKYLIIIFVRHAHNLIRGTLPLSSRAWSGTVASCLNIRVREILRWNQILSRSLHKGVHIANLWSNFCIPSVSGRCKISSSSIVKLLVTRKVTIF
jgi:hypothetical protein